MASTVYTSSDAAPKYFVWLYSKYSQRIATEEGNAVNTKLQTHKSITAVQAQLSARISTIPQAS